MKYKKLQTKNNIIISDVDEEKTVLLNLNKGEDDIFILEGFEKIVFDLIREHKSIKTSNLISKLKESFEFEGKRIEDYLDKYIEKLVKESLIEADS